MKARARWIVITVIVVVVIVAVALVVLLTRGAGSVEDAASGTVTAPGVLPIVEETVTMTAFIPSIGFINDIETNASVMALEEATNVHIEWIESSKVDARDKLTILLAGGDYPDMIQGASGAGISIQELFHYGRQGTFRSLNDLIDDHGFYIKELFGAEPFIESAVRSPDGNIYGLPAVSADDYHMILRQKMWINTTWLDNLGLAMPRTLGEFYNTLVAFKEQDANGNGDPGDEIPLTGSKRHLEDTAMWIMNSFIVAGGQDDSGDALLNEYEFIVDGRVLFNANKREFREGLRFIRRVYQEGLLDVAALTQDRDQMKPLVDGGDSSRIGAVASHHPGNFANLTEGEDARWLQYASLPPLEGPGGNQTTPWFTDAVVVPGQLVITNKAEYPAVALRWADYQFSLAFGLQERGVEGVHWRRVDPAEGLIGLNGEPAKYAYVKVLTPEDGAQINLGPGWNRDLKNEFASGEGAFYEELLYNATKPYDPYKVARFPWATAPIAAEDIEEFNDLRRTIHTFVGESVDRFIIGDLDIESDWDSYLARLDQIGIDRFIQILSNAYSSAE
jgi:putative aldouronate transport system substrate-binding protein